MSIRNDAKIALLDQNILVLDSEVNGDMADDVYESLMVLESRKSPDIEIRIFTRGGDVRAGLHIYDDLRRYKGKKIGLVHSFAHSMGAIILQACDERVSTRHAYVLIHHVNTSSISLDVIESPRRLAELQSSMRVDQQALYAILAKRTGKSVAQIRAACRKEREMGAEEAKAFGLIDRIDD